MSKLSAILLAVLVLAAAYFYNSSQDVAPPEEQGPSYDLVILNGRVIDPETGLDEIQNVGISYGQIVTITDEEITGEQSIDATGQVVSPGFIDLHAHGQNTIAQTYQVRDGVTTALELEGGLFEFVKNLEERDGSSLINYGFSAGFGDARLIVKDGDFKRSFHEVATDEERAEILNLVEQNILDGAIGIGLPLDYLSLGVNDEELEGLFRLSAKYQMPLYTHIRMADDASDPLGLVELIEMARKTGGILHMVHLVSTGLERVPLYMQMIDDAQAEGLDVTTEAYPYTAGSTGINSGIFDHDWQKKFNADYPDIEWPPTGERFTGKEMWDEYREKYPDGIIIIHVMKEEWVEQAYAHPGIMVASDGMPIDSLDMRAHPRGMGTFSRVLGRYVREKGILTLPDAISRMTYLPAKRMEEYTPVMKRKGRVSVGADADITIFNPDTVIDTATFADPNQFSEGISHVIVGGEIVVKDEALVENVFPGKPLSTKTK